LFNRVQDLLVSKMNCNNTLLAELSIDEMSQHSIGGTTKN